MAETEVKKSAGTKLNAFLEKNRSIIDPRDITVDDIRSFLSKLKIFELLAVSDVLKSSSVVKPATCFV